MKKENEKIQNMNTYTRKSQQKRRTGRKQTKVLIVDQTVRFWQIRPLETRLKQTNVTPSCRNPDKQTRTSNKNQQSNKEKTPVLCLPLGKVDGPKNGKETECWRTIEPKQLNTLLFSCYIICLVRRGETFCSSNRRLSRTQTFIVETTAGETEMLSFSGGLFQKDSERFTPTDRSNIRFLEKKRISVLVLHFAFFLFSLTITGTCVLCSTHPTQTRDVTPKLHDVLSIQKQMFPIGQKLIAWFSGIWKKYSGLFSDPCDTEFNRVLDLSSESYGKYLIFLTCTERWMKCEDLFFRVVLIMKPVNVSELQPVRFCSCSRNLQI